MELQLKVRQSSVFWSQITIEVVYAICVSVCDVTNVAYGSVRVRRTVVSPYRVRR